MVTHTHLDQRRRERGDCPACDLLWAAQDRRLQPTERELPKKPSVPEGRPPGPGKRFAAGNMCPAMFVGRGGTWICDKPRNHPDEHYCPLHDAPWENRK